jgi:hypothetical protein
MQPLMLVTREGVEGLEGAACEGVQEVREGNFAKAGEGALLIVCCGAGEHQSAAL